jgi:hypothetical protein
MIDNIENTPVTVKLCGAMMGEATAYIIVYACLGYLAVRGIIWLAGYMYDRRKRHWRGRNGNDR